VFFESAPLTLLILSSSFSWFLLRAGGRPPAHYWSFFPLCKCELNPLGKLPDAQSQHARASLIKD